MKKSDTYFFEYGRNYETIRYSNNKANIKSNSIQHKGFKRLATEAELIQRYRYEDKVQYKEGKRHTKGHRIRNQYQVFHSQRKGKPYTVLAGLALEKAYVRSKQSQPSMLLKFHYINILLVIVANGRQTGLVIFCVETAFYNGLLKEIYKGG
jgi:hypothetical protein